MSYPIPPKSINFTKFCDPRIARDPVSCSFIIKDLTNPRGKVTVRDLNEAIELYETAMKKLTWLEFGTSPKSGEKLAEYQKTALESLQRASVKLDLKNSDPVLYEKLESCLSHAWKP